MAEHTPGPWTTRQRVKHSAAIWEVAHPSEQGDIARVALRPKRPEEAEANARLIAAAPLLLEALETAVDEYLGEWGEPQQGYDPPPSWFTAARAAITKAKGES